MSGEAPRPIEELAARADELVAAGAAAGAPLRVMGGIAVRLRATDLGGIDPARRAYHDVDLVGRLHDVRAIDAAITGLGYEPDRAINAQFGTVRRVYYHPSGFHLDLFFERLEFCHTIDLRGRLDIAPRTLAPADLLLQKLQIVERNEKDILDVYWLLLNHELTRADPAGIALDRITGLTSADWGLDTTAREFLEQAAGMAGAAGLREDARAVVQGRLGAVREAIEQAPKSGRWSARARLGRRVRWYRTVEEVL